MQTSQLHQILASRMGRQHKCGVLATAQVHAEWTGLSVHALLLQACPPDSALRALNISTMTSTLMLQWGETGCTRLLNAGGRTACTACTAPHLEANRHTQQQTETPESALNG